MRYDTKYEIHPAAELFPMLSDEAYAQLRDDIRQHGQLDEIILFEGRVLDGRNRLRACVELGIDPFHAELEECKSPVAYVLSKNLHRRHLTSSQLAAVATKALPLLEEEAGVRKSEGQKSGGRGKKKTLPNELGKDKHDRAAAEQAAKLTGSNRQYVQDAKKIATADPELFKKVESGEVTIPQAKRILEPPKKP